MFAILWLLTAVAPGAEATSDKPAKPKRPALELRVAPRFGFTPLRAVFTAELKGGDDVEEYYCPEVLWEWGDGGKSSHQPDCPPFEPEMKIERRFIGEHEYRRAANYSIKVTLKRAGHAFASQAIALSVRRGALEPYDGRDE